MEAKEILLLSILIVVLLVVGFVIGYDAGKCIFTQQTIETAIEQKQIEFDGKRYDVILREELEWIPVEVAE